MSCHTGTVTDDPRPGEEPVEPADEHTRADEEVPPDRDPVERAGLPSLNHFSAVQRHLASFDFSAVHAAQRAIKQADVFKKVMEAQDAIASAFARSIDFSRLIDTYRAVIGAGAVSQARAAQQRWAESLAKSIDYSALSDALTSSAALDSFLRSSEVFNQSLREQTELFAQIARTVTFELPTIDISGLLEALDRWIPINLRDGLALDVVATIALEDGLPLSWVPRSEIVLLLVEAGGWDARIGILTERRSDILDDCEEAIESIDHEWAVQCRSAIAAMRADLDGPAQSHASNIIDSIVLRLHGQQGREHAKKQVQEGFDDLPLQLVAENLTLRPLFQAFTTWFPNTSIDPPDYFARHATSHAVGHAGVFAPISALVAVMLATSLTVQYAPIDPTDDASNVTP